MNAESLLAENGDFSDEARDFVRCCVHTNPEDRPTANDLLKHPWIAEGQCEEAEFDEWLAQAYELRGQKK